MGKVKFIINRLKHTNFKALFSTAGRISKKTKRFYPVVLLDIVYCGLKYQAGYNDYLEFEFYLLDKNQRKTYLTAGINNNIIKKYNSKEHWHKLDDKIEFNHIFKEYLGRRWIDLRQTSVNEFEQFVKQYPVIIVKPLDECGGKGIEKFDFNEKLDAKKIYEKLIKNGQVLVEEFVKQHHDMDKLYSGSLNTLRIFTVLTDEAHYLEGILKFGNGGIVDNFSSGGMYTFVNEQGEVIAPAIDKNDNVYESHPVSKVKIIGFKVPMYDEVKKLVCEAAKKVPEVKYIGWDVAITEKGPIIIEGNCYPGVFQLRPSFSKDKIGNLSKYRKYMDI